MLPNNETDKRTHKSATPGDESNHRMFPNHPHLRATSQNTAPACGTAITKTNTKIYDTYPDTAP